MPWFRFDYKCSHCPDPEVDDRFVQKEEMDKQVCQDCGQAMYRLPAATITHFRFADKKLKK